MYSDAFHISKSTVPDSRKFFCAKSKHKCIIRLIGEMERKAVNRHSTLNSLWGYVKAYSDLFLQGDAPYTYTTPGTEGSAQKGKEEVLPAIYDWQRENTRWRNHSSSFSHYLLPDLNHSLPEILSFYSMAISTHLGLNNIIHHKHLLKDSTIHHLIKKTITLLHSFLSV